MLLLLLGLLPSASETNVDGPSYRDDEDESGDRLPRPGMAGPCVRP